MKKEKSLNTKAVKSKAYKQDNVRHVTKAKLAETLGVSVATVDAWLRKGCPYVEKGAKNKPWVFDLKAVIKWVREYKEPKGTSTLADLQHEKWRLIRAKAAIAELELGVAEGTLLNAAAVIAERERSYSMIKKRMIALSSKVVPLLIGKTPTEIKIIIDDEVYETLTAIADIDLEEDGEEIYDKKEKD